MDFVVKTHDFLNELQYVQGVVERKTTVPILSNFLLETTGSSLVVTATDLDVTIQCACPASVKVSGSLTIAARKLTDLVRLLPDSDIHFKAASPDWVNLTCQRSRYKIATLPQGNFPDIPMVEGATMALPARALRYMINHAIFAITQEESRYTLNGALLILTAGKMTIVTTDGHRMVLIVHKCEMEGIDGETRVLVPRKTLAELSKLLSEDTQTVDFSRTDNHMFFKAGDRLLVSRILTGQFPNYEMVVPKDNDRKITLNTLEFSDALKRVAVMADDQSRSARFTIEPGQIDISTVSAEYGEARESLEADYAGEPLEIGFNANYILDFLYGLESESVVLELRDKETQGMLRPLVSEEYDYKYVVMPMKL